MASLNKVSIIGNLGRDPELRNLPSGDAITNIAVATTDKWKDKNTGEKREQTEWHRITAFGPLAEIMAKYLVKGSQVYIEGKLRTRKYTDKDGIERYATEIVADTLQMLGGNPNRQQDDGSSYHEPAQRPQQRTSPAAPAARPQPRPAPNFSDMDDDIPF